MRRCAKYGNGWLPYMFTPERLRTSVSRIAALRADIGREDPITPGICLNVVVHPHRDTARRMALEHLSDEYNQDFSSLVDKYAVYGTPDDCAAQLRQFVEAGARTLICLSVCSEDYVTENEALLAEKVLSQVRQP